MTDNAPWLIPYDADVLGKFFNFDIDDATCTPSIHFAWDQWVVCKIRCPHGEFKSSSGLLNFTEAFVKARRKWAKADHLEFIDD